MSFVNFFTPSKNTTKEKNEEKALFYSSASANYATIYQTVCKD